VLILFGVKGAGHHKEKLILEGKKMTAEQKMDNDKNLQGLHVYDLNSKVRRSRPDFGKK